MRKTNNGKKGKKHKKELQKGGTQMVTRYKNKKLVTREMQIKTIMCSILHLLGG